MDSGGVPGPARRGTSSHDAGTLRFPWISRAYIRTDALGAGLVSDLLPPGVKVAGVNGRERFNGQFRRCRSTAHLTLVVAGGIRLEILKSLVIASRDVTHLANELELDISMVSHNLRVLKDYGLAASRTLEQ